MDCGSCCTLGSTPLWFEVAAAVGIGGALAERVVRGAASRRSTSVERWNSGAGARQSVQMSWVPAVGEGTLDVKRCVYARLPSKYLNLGVCACVCCNPIKHAVDGREEANQGYVESWCGQKKKRKQTCVSGCFVATRKMIQM